MSWQTASANVGLAGLTEEEAAVGALLLPSFQGLPDPLKLNDSRPTKETEVWIYLSLKIRLDRETKLHLDREVLN